MAENKLTNILPFIRAFFYNVAIVLKEMINEELVKLSVRAVRVFIDFSCQSLAEN